MFTFLKIAVSACVIAFASWLSGKRPELAGFITALPFVTLLALVFSYAEYKNVAVTSTYARSIILAVPVTWLFFIPFFFTEKWNIGFWPAYAAGLILLVAGYFIHQYMTKFLA